MKRELLELILLKLIKNNAWYDSERNTVISAIEEELAKPLPKPVAIVNSVFSIIWYNNGHTTPGLKTGDFLYTSPPMRETLSNDEIIKLCGYDGGGYALGTLAIDIAREIEKAHGIVQ